MYFHSRIEAGEILARQLMQYRYDNCAVVALSLGAVMVGASIAQKLHCVLGLFLTESIEIPGENVCVGTVNQGGGFVYSKSLTDDEANDYYGEFHSYIDDQKREKAQKINRLLASGGSLDTDRLKEHVVIIVADGLKDSESLEAVFEYLKPVKIKRLIVASPIASVPAVDRMHILADELHCLGVTENYIDTQHYYDVKDVPTYEQATTIINNIILNWT